MKILAIETSCDETSIALVTAREGFLTIHSHKTASQAEFHSQYGGVFPAMAKREHVKACVPLLASVFTEADFGEAELLRKNSPGEAQLLRIREILEREPELAEALLQFAQEASFPELDMIAVTNGPGLEMALWVGINFAKALGVLLGVPVVGINHMEGHLVSPILPEEILHTEIQLKNIPENVITLLVSGGHTEIIHMQDGRHKLLGETLDDAVGEAFDKVARLMGLSYPGGPLISKLAEEAREKNIAPIDLPRPMMSTNDYNFSYSGLKTAVMYHIRKHPLETNDDKLALALGFENAAIEVLVKKTVKAIEETGASTLFLGGGVAANKHLKHMLRQASKERNFDFYEPIPSLTGDNALMIALAAYMKFQNIPIKDESPTLTAIGMLPLA